MTYSRPRTWISDSGCFLFGKYKDDLVEEIASRDPSYLRWILDTATDIDEEDRQIIAACLRRHGKDAR